MPADTSCLPTLPAGASAAITFDPSDRARVVVCSGADAVSSEDEDSDEEDEGEEGGDSGDSEEEEGEDEADQGEEEEPDDGEVEGEVFEDVD